MKTTIYFHVTEELQKKLLAAGKDANESQSIELDITDQELIDRAKINKNGEANIRIDSYEYHYDNKKNWTSINYRFNEIPNENDLIVFFKNVELREIYDEEIRKEKDEERTKQQKIREEKEEIEEKEREKQKAEEKIQQEKDQKEIDSFVEQKGSSKLKLRKELGYEYNHLAVNEMIDEIECKYEKIENIDNYDSNYIDYPSERMMQAEKKLLKNKGVKDVRCVLLEEKTNEYNYDEEKEKIEAFKIVYFVLGYEKVRYYIFT